MNSLTLPSRKIRDIRGEIFGRLTVEGFSHVSPKAGRNAYWICRCSCGNRVVVHSGALRSKSTKSCGCLATEINRVLIKKTHNKGQHLYFIKSGPYVKIGRADKPELRLNQIRAANPYGAELLGVLYDQGFREKSLHRLYKNRLHSGEWFKF